MSNFHDLFEYNDWANQQLIEVSDRLTDEQLLAPMPELGGSVLGLFSHVAQVEANFLALMTGHERPPRAELAYIDMKALLTRNANGYRAALPDLLQRLDSTFELPWFGRTFRVEQALTQVATHSVQHRAGVAAGIARAGREAPGLDYIIWASQFR